MKLTDICDFQGGSQPPKEEWSLEVQEGYIRMLQIRDFTQSEKVQPEYIKISNTTKMCEADDILIARYGASIGKILTGLAGAYNVAIMRTIPDTNRIQKKYLFYYLKSPYFQNAIMNVGVRAAQAGFNKEDLSKLEIECPSMSEQSNIIKRLTKIDIVINKRKKEMRLLDDLIRARFVELFGDPIDNSKGYPVHQLSEYITSLTSGSRGWAQYCVDDGDEWFITIKNVKDCHIFTDNMQPVNAPDNAEAKRTKVQEGDLLISITADLGRTGVVTKEIAEHGAYINQHLSCIRINRDVLNPLFVAHYMESPAGKEQFIAKNQSAVKAGLNFNSINSLKLIVPPLAEQNRFIDFIDQVDKSKIEVQKALDETQKLFDSLMQQYFG